MAARFPASRFPKCTSIEATRGLNWACVYSDWPEITIRYSHEFRDGQKDSTIWGDTDSDRAGSSIPLEKLCPSFRDIDETRDIFSFEASKTIGNTDVLLGMRYEHNDER